MYPSIFLLIVLSIYLSIYLSFHLPIYLSKIIFSPKNVLDLGHLAGLKVAAALPRAESPFPHKTVNLIF